jgi:hypothetical protein
MKSDRKVHKERILRPNTVHTFVYTHYFSCWYSHCCSTIPVLGFTKIYDVNNQSPAHDFGAFSNCVRERSLKNQTLYLKSRLKSCLFCKTVNKCSLYCIQYLVKNVKTKMHAYSLIDTLEEPVVMCSLL